MGGVKPIQGETSNPGTVVDDNDTRNDADTLRVILANRSSIVEF